MRQKIDIADVEAATKIRAKYLRALENEEFGLLPGATFTKTFLRTYADYLGLDAQLLVEEYRVEHEPRGEEVAPITATRTPRRQRRGGGGVGGGRGGPSIGPPSPGVVFGFIFVLLLAGILILGLTADEEEPDGGGDQTEQARDEQRTERQRARERRAARRRAAARRRRREEARFVRLRLAPQEPIYACVVDGSGKQLFGGTLEDSESFRARRIRINLGRTSIRVTVNGDRLRIPPSSNPVGYDLRPGRKPRPLPLGQRPNC
jgi:hypothetical protein